MASQGKPRHPKHPIASLSLNVLNGEQCQGKARQAKPKPRYAIERQGKARQGKARQAKATTCQSKARQGMSRPRQGKARQGMPRPRQACQGKVRQGMPRQVKAVRRECKYVKIQSVRWVASPSFRGKLNGNGGGGTNRSDAGLNLSGSWQQGHSATYNTPSRI